jgi:hypothetical protein
MTEEASVESALRVCALMDYGRPLAVATAARLGLADACRDARPLAMLATETGLDATALGRLLRALVSYGLFEEPRPGVFGLAASGQFLCDDHPWSLRHAYALMRADVRAWAHMQHSLQTGLGTFEHVHGRSLWEHLAADPQDSACFDRAMEDMSRLEALWLFDAYDWTRFESVVDVGGGNGSLLMGLLAALPNLRGVLYDLPQVVERARPRLAGTPLASRLVVMGGDFFQHVPAGHDAYLMKRIIYSYDDDDAQRILACVRAGMRVDSRLLLLEPVRRRGSGFDYGKLLDVQMLILGGGRVRERQDLRSLLASAGLALRRVIPTPLAAIVEAVPA